MSGAIRQISNYLTKNKPTIWHFRITSSLSSQNLEDNLEYLRAMRHKEGSVFALSVSSFQRSRDTARVITFYDALKQASERLRAPLYTFSEDQALGDSYLLLSLGEEVTANPFSIIGTTSQPAFMPSRKPSPEDVKLAEQSNNEILESIQDLILLKRGKAFESKGISREQAKKDLLSGQTFTADQALKNGLIDKVGTFYDFKDLCYPNHRIRSPQRYPGQVQFLPQLNKDLLILAEMAQEVELVLGSASASTPMQSIVSSSEVKLAEFFNRKLKEPEFLMAFENYLLNEFENQKAMIERRQDLLNMLS